MVISGVIAEYNPFHKGHRYQIEEIKKNIASHVVVVMSGNFVQRGDFAIFDKYARAAAAVASGADLVMELPIETSLSSAQQFSLGGVELLNSLDCVDYLSFGAESPSINELEKARQLLRHKDLDVKKHLKKGLSYPSAKMEAVIELNKREKILDENNLEMLSRPNNILGFEYLDALKKTKSKIKPYLIQRHKTNHDSHLSVNNFASATMIRERIYSNKDYEKYITKNNQDSYKKIIEQGEYIDRDRVDFLVLSHLKRLDVDDFFSIADVVEGLENRIVEKTKTSFTLEELYRKINTKRYTEARIRRIVINAFLGLTKSTTKDILYTKVLAFNKKGTEILKKIKKSSNLSVITNLSGIKYYSKSLYNLERRASALYGFAMKKPFESDWEYKKQITLIR